ncbi:aspartate aminotransferase family protein [Streptomyces jumonjinensis]|uniref:Aminotransferase class III-fold pyridoxal phosphate-dependent enzyme n=1 Tax=Streptomyces jumonjinensis TaxID=1945 RepID=A0A646KHQ2_STRJU|nr:glutamate-1-semialdehyde 2,1-aminomutase [Streptomyces jumonjinensis]MQT01527.1 aminotransferase class III-fold pyridoxal phosphate-dependent enzyme [Streptomyces jumonjinensis]
MDISSSGDRTVAGRPPSLGGTALSAEWFERAKKSLAGGISSSSRLTSTGPDPYPLYMSSGSGARIRDVDGNEYLDYLLSYGSAVLGHAHPALTEGLARVLASGTMFGTCNVPEVELAELIQELVPCAELVRFANSGSEAVQGAVRAARGATGRSRLLKFEGHYHGWTDSLAISNRPTPEEAGPYEAPRAVPHSPGIPAGVVDDVVVCPWNDPEALKAVFAAHPGEFAAAVCEPIVANNACGMPAPGFLELLRDLCTAERTVLIFDEVCTGFRTGQGGAQTLFGVRPDLAVFSKALGGGLPLAAFAGVREVMEPLASGQVKHGGTYNSSPLCATAGVITLRHLADPAVTGRIDATGRQIMETIRRAARDRRIPCAVQGVGAMFQVVFTPDGQPTREYRDTFRLDRARYDAFRHELLLRGVHSNAYGLACWFVSAAVTDDELARTCEAIEESFAALV